uniref:Uncharacterized protein n=1 Tax=Picea glauca TaxID=3330 RepID=A0A101LZX3_PICGL|nr:hypothetical protein ABT39_MTgene5298 [Picea glauca]
MISLPNVLCIPRVCRLKGDYFFSTWVMNEYFPLSVGYVGNVIDNLSKQHVLGEELRVIGASNKRNGPSLRQSLMLLAQMLLDIYIEEGMAIEMTMDLDLLLVHVHGQ